MTEPGPLTPEEKSAVLSRIRRAYGKLRSPGWAKAFAGAVIWTLQAGSALQMLEASERKVSGSFRGVSEYLAQERLLDDHEKGNHSEAVNQDCPECARELGEPGP